MDYRVQWITHKGTKILENNYHGLQGKQLQEQITKCVDFVVGSGKNDILLLVNVEGVEVSTATQLWFAQAAKTVKPYCSRTAVVGLNPIKQKILNAINGIVRLGAEGKPTELDAKNWLVGMD